MPNLHSTNLAGRWGRVAACLAVMMCGAAPAARAQGNAGRVVSDTAATGRLLGVVTDSAGTPVVGARVEAGPRFVAVTDSKGAFALRGLPRGPLVLSVRRLGYAPSHTQWELGDIALTLHLRIDPFPVMLAPVVARAARRPYDARLAGFYERRAQHLGYSFDRAQIDSIGTFRMTELLQRVPGVRKYTMRGALGTSVTMSGASCPPLVMVDGFPAALGRFDLDMVDLTTVEGVEVYLHGSTVPSSLAGPYGMENCGLIAIWSRPMRPNVRAARALPTRRVNLDSLLAADAVYTAASVDTPASYSEGTGSPVYPDSLYRASAPGRVVARFVVDTLGRVEPASIHILSATAPPFESAVEQALPSARFSPARRDGRLVRQIVEMPFEFKPGPADTASVQREL